MDFYLFLYNRLKIDKSERKCRRQIAVAGIDMITLRGHHVYISVEGGTANGNRNFAAVLPGDLDGDGRIGKVVSAQIFRCFSQIPDGRQRI